MLGFFASESVRTHPLAAADRPGGTLVYGRGGDAVHLDPARAEDGESVVVIDNLFDGLVRYADKGVAVEPCLAKRWTVSPDGKTWRFSLVEGVTFHDGGAFTADDVVFTFERLVKKDHPFHDPEMVNENLFPIERITAVSPLEVEMVLSRPIAGLLGNLTTYTAKIVSKAAVTRAGLKECDQRPVGTGPFSFKAWEHEQKIVLDAYKKHFRGAPDVDRLVLVTVKENSARVEQLRAGKLHVIDGLTPTTAKEVLAAPDLVLVRKTGMNIGYLSINCERKPFDDPRVRRALALAIDRKRLVDLCYQGMAEVARNPMPPFLLGWDDRAPEPVQDLDGARKLLAEAGVKTPLEVELWHMPIPRPYCPEPLPVALVIADDLKKIGIEAKLVREEWKQYLAKTKRGAHTLGIFGWTGDTCDPDNFLYLLLGKDNTDATNVCRYADEGVNAKLLAAQVETDPKKRADLYKDIQAKLREDAPMVPLVHAEQLAAARANVRGLELHPTGRRELKNVYVEK